MTCPAEVTTAHPNLNGYIRLKALDEAGRCRTLTGQIAVSQKSVNAFTGVQIAVLDSSPRQKATQASYGVGWNEDVIRRSRWAPTAKSS